MKATPQRRSQSGAMSIRMLTIIIVVVVVGYLAYKFVPPYIMYYRVSQVLNSEVNRPSEEERMANIEFKLRELPNCPIKFEDVKFSWDSRTGVLTISADYTVDVSLPGGYVKTLVFHPEATSKR